MLIEFHCTCGHRQPLEPGKLKPALRCSACKAALRFVPEGKKIDAARWLAVGGQSGGPRLAAPVPFGATLKIGRAVSGFLALPGEEIDEAQTELRLEDDGRLHVKHLSGDCGTWINRARIITGVLGETDKLRIGPYVLSLMTQSDVVAAAAATLEPDVIIETDESEDGEEAASAVKPRRHRKPSAADVEVIVEADDEEDVATSDEEPDLGARWSTGQKARIAVCSVIILAVGVFLMRNFIWPPLSGEMPRETDFYCPVDGNVVRGTWTAASGAPICPQCGQRCVGELRYKEEPLHPPPGESPAEDEADAAGGAVAGAGRTIDSPPTETDDAASSPAKGDATGKADAVKTRGDRPKRASREDKGGAS